jgi:polyisoprenyl-teichoic acid--peptidoglycan teichoic acid transferase
MARNVHELDVRTRAKRRREKQAQYRRRRLMAALVLLDLMLVSGVYAANFFQGGSDPSYSARKVEEARSVDVAKAGFRESPDASGGFPETAVQEGQAPATEATGPDTSWDAESTREAPNDPAKESPPEAYSASLDVLVLGMDRRPNAGEDSPTRSDTIVLVRVSPKTGRIESLSVPRDFLVEVESGVQDRINTAYAYGGIERAEAVMEGLTNISIDRHAIVDFGGFEDVVDALGGITVDVEQPIRIGIEGHRVYIPAGRQKLNGLEALAYARYRGTPCGDLDRIERQQRLVAALRKQALGWNTITRLPGIVKVMHENVDTDLGIVQTISLGRALIGHGEKGGLRSYQLRGVPETLPNGDAVLVPDERANQRILENLRDDSPKSPRQSPRLERAPGDDDSSSGC